MNIHIGIYIYICIFTHIYIHAHPSSNAKQSSSNSNFQSVITCYRPMLGAADDDEAAQMATGVSLLPGWPMFQESQTAGADRPYKSSVVHVVCVYIYMYEYMCICTYVCT